MISTLFVFVLLFWLLFDWSYCYSYCSRSYKYAALIMYIWIPQVSHQVIYQAFRFRFFCKKYLNRRSFLIKLQASSLSKVVVSYMWRISFLVILHASSLLLVKLQGKAEVVSWAFSCNKFTGLTRVFYRDFHSSYLNVF